MTCGFTVTSSLFTLAALASISLPLPASAQTGGTNVAFGYSFLRLLDDVDESLPLGWIVSFATPVNPSAPATSATTNAITANHSRLITGLLRLHNAEPPNTPR